MSDTEVQVDHLNRSVDIEPDIYDREIARLTKSPGDIYESWMRGSPLFRYLTPSGYVHAGIDYGCPTMIKNGRISFCDSITDAVRATKIPTSLRKILVEHLPVFADIQRMCDIVLDRTPPEVQP